MKVKLSVVTLLASAVLSTALFSTTEKSQDAGRLMKPSLTSINESNHLEKLLSFESKERNSLNVNQEEKDITLKNQITYLESLDSNSLLETLGEISLYDDQNFNRYGETIGALLMKKWNGVVPNEITEIFVDKDYSTNFRGFALDAMVNTGQQLVSTNIDHIQRVIHDKSEDPVLRKYALISMKASNLENTSIDKNGQSLNLITIFKDEQEPVEVRAAAVTAMGRLDDPNYKIALNTLAEKNTNQDKYLLRTLFVSSANNGMLEDYMGLLKETLSQTKDQEIFESAIYGLATQGGKDAVRIAMQYKDKFSGTAQDIIRYALLSNTSHILSLLDSEDPNDILLAINAAEILQFGEAYKKISDIQETSTNKDIIQASTDALKNIDPTSLLDPNKTGKFGR